MSDIEQVKLHWVSRPVYNGKDRVETLLPLINGRGYISGSFAAWACSYLDEPWKPNDIDIFAKSDEDAASLVDDLNRGADYWEDERNELVTTFKAEKEGDLGIQIIRPSPEWKTFPDDVINSFDLGVCRALIVDLNTVLCDTTAGTYYGKVLRINNPLRTFKRIAKYMARGVEFSDHELLKVFRAWDATTAVRKEGWLKDAAAILEQADSDGIGYDDFFDEDDYFDAE